MKIVSVLASGKKPLEMSSFHAAAEFVNGLQARHDKSASEAICAMASRQDAEVAAPPNLAKFP